MTYDGRDLSISPWQDQKVFRVGYHYETQHRRLREGMSICSLIINLKPKSPQLVKYPDLTEIEIVD